MILGTNFDVDFAKWIHGSAGPISLRVAQILSGVLSSKHSSRVEKGFTIQLWCAFNDFMI